MTLFDTPVRTPAIQSMMDRMLEGIGEGWQDVFRGGDEILYDTLYQISARTGDEVICPASGDVFNAFRECKYSKLRVVFLLQDPYHQVINGARIADGLAMSCSKTGILQPSLKLVYDEIERTVGKTDRNPDLRPWANQGVLMLNTALTVKQANPGSHADIWRPFTQYLLRELGRRSNKIIYILAGANAKSFRNFVTGVPFYVTHPASAAYKGGRWDCDDVFNRVNEELTGDKIKW